MSSPNLNNIILLGAQLAFMSIMFSGADSVHISGGTHLLTCKFYNWTLSLGFSCAFGAMFSKTWRVHKIFTNKKIQRMVIRDYQLIVIVCVLVGLDVLVLTVWEFTDPLKIVKYNKSLEIIPDPANDNQVLIPQTSFCESPHMWKFAGILYAIKGLLLVFGAFLAFETRAVSVPALNDSKFIGISVYNVVVLCLVGVPIALMMKEQLDASYVLISLFIFFATTVTICLVFIPKVINRNKEPHDGKMWSKTMDSSAATGTQRPMLSTVLNDLERIEIERLREENVTLKQALDQCQMRLRDYEACHVNGLSPSTMSEDIQDLLPHERLLNDSTEEQLT